MRRVLLVLGCALGAGAMAAPALAWKITTPSSIISSVTKHRERVGQCFVTRVRWLGGRLEGPGGPDRSGSGMTFTDGHSNVSYEYLRGVARSKPGDRVRLCVLKLPTNCPPGDTRGILYRGANLRTGLTWKATDTEHLCGGA